MTYEDGAGISQISIFHKNRMIHSLEATDDLGRIKWKFKFFLPSSIRK